MTVLEFFCAFYVTLLIKLLISRSVGIVTRTPCVLSVLIIPRLQREFQLQHSNTQAFKRHLSTVGKLAYLYATPPGSPAAHRTVSDTPVALSIKGRNTGMDHDRHRGQLESTHHFGSQAGLPPNAAQYTSVSASERYRPPSLVAQSSGSAGAGGRGSGSASSYGYGYGDNNSFVGSSMPQSGIPYQPTYSESSQRTPQHQYQYGGNMMFGSQQQQQQQTQQQAPPQSSFEAVQQYQPQENVALGVLSSQLEVPRQYFVPGEGALTSAPAATAMTQQQHIPSQYSTMSHTYPQSAGRTSLAAAYGSGMSDPTHAGSQGAYGQQQDYSVQGAETWTESVYEYYETGLRETFQFTHDGRLAEAAETLLRISSWLLQNAETLGMHPCFVVLWTH